MGRFFKDRGISKGKIPGSIIFIGDRKTEEAYITLFDYDASELSEKEKSEPEELRDLPKTDTVSWINLYGIHDTEKIKLLGDIFSIHPLSLEDIANTAQRPKFEDFDNYLFLSLKMLSLGNGDDFVHSEQISLALGKNFLLTFQERRGDVFAPVRERIRNSKGRIRKRGADYLAYALLDTITDNYINIVGNIGDKIEDMEEEVLHTPSDDTIKKINNYKRELNFLKKNIRPAKDALMLLARSDSPLLNSENTSFYNDLLDLITHTVETIDSYREMLSDYLNIYNANISNKLNDIMKVLTIFSALFIPLSFLAGVYGTNFEYLPELKFHYSYFIFWGLVLLIGSGMLYYFRKKGWIGSINKKKMEK